MNKIDIVGVVGAGTMGAALAQKFAQEGFQVILVDRIMSQVDKGLNNIQLTLEEGIQRKVFTKEQVVSFISKIHGSDKLEDLKDCDIIVEAIYENFDAKKELLRSLSGILKNDCIVATNTSSFSVTELSNYISFPERFIGLHFFYHAAKNRLLEIIPGAKTSKKVIDRSKLFTSLIGKDPVDCKDSYGFAINRFFVPWLNEAVRILEEGLVTTNEIDTVCMKTFGINMGPFALMNATGVPVAYHSEKSLEIFGSLYKTATLLQTQAQSGKQWEFNSETANDINAEKEKIISERMLGVVFFICSQILDEEVCSATHLNRGARIGLQWKKGPIELMISSSSEVVNHLVGIIAKKYGMHKPLSIGDHFWKMKLVKLEKNNGSAIITIDQPESLNALSEDTVKELMENFNLADQDPLINTIYITGSGKAFVAGADIKFFIKNIKSNKLSEIESFTRYTQKVFDDIDNSTKTVVMIINGIALGGGLELALCADIILAVPNAMFSFPETGIGIYPALGGTQRSVRRIGKGLCKYLIHTGKMLSAKEAEEIGLIDKIISREESMEILSGNQPVSTNSKMNISDNWKYIKEFFEHNTLKDIQDNSFHGQSIDAEVIPKIIKSISFKAPVAIKIADKLIEEGKGCESELNYLHEIFSTSDAILGLTSIGQKVQYLGK